MPLSLQKAYNYDYIQGTSWLLYRDQRRSMRLVTVMGLRKHYKYYYTFECVEKYSEIQLFNFENFD